MNIIPFGHIAPRLAVEQVGKSLFPDSWTNKESTARKGLIAVEEWRAALTTPAKRSGSGARSITFSTNPDSRQRWPFGDPEAAAYQNERAAFLRWTEAIEETRSRLERGILIACRKLQNGRLQKIPGENWAADGASHLLFQEDVCIERFALAQTNTSAPISKAAVRRALGENADGKRTEKEVRALVSQQLRVESVSKTLWRECWAEVPSEKKLARGGRRRS